MSATDLIKTELSNLLQQQDALIGFLDKHATDRIIAFGTAYQAWYTRALKVLELLAPDRMEEFSSYYRVDPRRKSLDAETYVIQDYINALGTAPDVYGKKRFDERSLTTIRLVNQTQILESLNSRIDSVLGDIKGTLLAELEDSELNAAKKLISINIRAAGSLAGVVLERHLQRVAENHGVSIKKREPTVGDLNDPLKEKGVYGIPIWRKIQYLADIRNACCHQKTVEPTKEQVSELIDGVNAIIKSIF